MKKLKEVLDLNHKMVADYKALVRVIDGLRVLGYKIVVTSGTWDLLHIGHVRYLSSARRQGDILLVGVDTDRTVRLYKGELRPIVPFEERCEMLSYQSCVDLLTQIDDVNKKGEWQYGLLDVIRPDVFVAQEGSYPKKQLEDIKKYVKELIVLPRQAERTSTSKMIQNAVKRHLDKMYQLLNER